MDLREAAAPVQGWRVAQVRWVPHVSFFETWVLAAEQMPGA
jgi:hypothetical protein